MIKVTIFNEYAHEVMEERIRKVYPDGIHGALKSFLQSDDISVRTVTLMNENQEINPEAGGLTDEVLADTDVLIWWGHLKHHLVPDEVVERVYNQILCGMGAIFLHSAHHSKLFRRLMGTTCNLSWREGEKERLYNIMPSHPIMEGIGDYFDLENEEMYGERFEIPTPDELLMLGTYGAHEVMRSACTFRRVNGKIFYFQPGHEEYPTYYNENVQRIITNAVYWANPTYRAKELTCPNTPAIEF